MSLILPSRPVGRTSIAAENAYQDELTAFADLIKQIKSTLDFRISSRGWCYQLEDHGLLKSDFDDAQKIINECRKCGLLPLNICADDKARLFQCIQRLDYSSVDYMVNDIWGTVDWHINNYTPESFWKNQACYLQIVVEKIDLLNLFMPICRKYNIPIANARGWSDLNMRADMMSRFKDYENQGKQCVLLYCGDHDPAGLNISSSLRNNLNELSKAVDWIADNLIIDRFGLNYDFIEKNELSWIDNLISSSGRDLSKPKKKKDKKTGKLNDVALEKYIADYIAMYRVRKVEANSLVVRPKEGRALCEQAVLRYVNTGLIPEYQSRLDLARVDLRTRFTESANDRYQKDVA